MNNVEVVIIIDNELVFYLFMVICVRRGVSTAKLKTMKKSTLLIHLPNGLSLRGAKRQNNPIKYEIATPFGFAMTNGGVKIFNGFVLVSKSTTIFSPVGGSQENVLIMV